MKRPPRLAAVRRTVHARTAMRRRGHARRCRRGGMASRCHCMNERGSWDLRRPRWHLFCLPGAFVRWDGEVTRRTCRSRAARVRFGGDGRAGDGRRYRRRSARRSTMANPVCPCLVDGDAIGRGPRSGSSIPSRCHPAPRRGLHGARGLDDVRPPPVGAERAASLRVRCLVIRGTRRRRPIEPAGPMTPAGGRLVPGWQCRGAATARGSR